MILKILEELSRNLLHVFLNVDTVPMPQASFAKDRAFGCAVNRSECYKIFMENENGNISKNTRNQKTCSEKNSR